MVPGRLLKISSDSVNWGWGILVSWTKQRINPKKIHAGSRAAQGLDILGQTESHYILDCYLYVKNKLTSDNVLQPGDPQAKDGRLGIVPVILHATNVNAVSTIQMNLPHNLNNQDNLKSIEKMYFEVMKRFKGGETLPILDPKDDMEIESKELDKLLASKEKVHLEL